MIDAYQKEIRPVCGAIELEKLAEDTEHYGEIAVIKAIERAAIRGKRNIGYMEGILKRWEANGYDEEDARPAKENHQISMAHRAIEMLGGDTGG